MVSDVGDSEGVAAQLFICWASVIPPTVRWLRSAHRSGGPSTRWSTATAGDRGCLGIATARRVPNRGNPLPQAIGRVAAGTVDAIGEPELERFRGCSGG